MSGVLGADYIEEIGRAAVEETTALIVYLIKEMIADGRAPWDVELDDAEFVAWFTEKWNAGVMETLRIVSPSLYDEHVKRFQRLSGQMLGVR